MIFLSFQRQLHLQLISFAIGVGASVLLCFFSGFACAEDKDHEPTIGAMVIQTIPARYYLAGGFETNFKSMGEPVVKTLTELMTTARENKIGLHGPVIHFYLGAPHRDPTKKFKMQTGFFVAEDTPAIGDFEARKLPPIKCATILYIGPASRIGDAWQKLYRSVRAKELTPTEDERELYLYWEGVESPNNIVQVQLGVE